MSEFLSKFLWESEGGTMESCYKVYTWINQIVLMLLLQVLWKMSQISDYFKEKPVDQDQVSKLTMSFPPLTKESKLRRHIRSMSDVQSSTPYKLPFRSRQGSHATLTYDSDTRAKRIRCYNLSRQLESTDSSDLEMPRKILSLEQNILKHTDSMRVL